MSEETGANNVSEYFRTPMYLEKLMQIFFFNNFQDMEKYRVILNKLVNNLVECVVKRPDIAKRFIRDCEEAYYLPTHSINTAVYAVSAIQTMDYEYSDLLETGLGALFHDLGMIYVPKKVITKSEMLTNEEVYMIQQHPKKGIELLGRENKIVQNIVLKHHEKFKGGGYPLGTSYRFSGDLLASVVGLADVFDAMTTFRIYKEKLTIPEARKYIHNEGTENWSKDVIAAFNKGLNRLGV